jgi:hypothetical protein
MITVDLRAYTTQIYREKQKFRDHAAGRGTGGHTVPRRTVRTVVVAAGGNQPGMITEVLREPAGVATISGRWSL